MTDETEEQDFTEQEEEFIRVNNKSYYSDSALHSIIPDLQKAMKDAAHRLNGEFADWESMAKALWNLVHITDSRLTEAYPILQPEIKTLLNMRYQFLEPYEGELVVAGANLDFRIPDVEDVVLLGLTG